MLNSKLQKLNPISESQFWILTKNLRFLVCFDFVAKKESSFDKFDQNWVCGWIGFDPVKAAFKNGKPVGETS